MSSQDRNKPLNIYRASAGSGKTHLLTGFYLKQLFLMDLLPETHSGEMHFSEVLAVTFTNKATAEMKGRIIDELYTLSQDPKSSDYWDEISQEGRRSEQSIRKKAVDLLVQILNDYSSFNISTIDSFFQKIVRSFARELNVPGNYEVELDSDSAIESAVSSFLDKLDPKQNSSLFDWMVRFTDKRSEEGEGWDIRNNLLSMSKKVLGSEEFRKHSLKIKEFTEDKKRLSDYEKMLRSIIANWRDQLVKIGKEGLDIMAQYGLENSDFAFGGSGTITHLVSWSKGEETDTSKSRFLEIIENPDKLFKKGTPRIGSDLQRTIVGLMESGRQLFLGDTYTNYVTAQFIQQDLYELGIIANIDDELREYCNDQNIMLLSSTTELLSKLIEPYDAPFIYEKTGTHLKSYMIDEFQDTSGMQWNNFTPLISNTLSQGYQNLIVGDVKQSIYRWRGSDWGLLDSEIGHYEPELHNDNDEALRTNWRSLPAIVNFNNEFFTQAAAKLDELAHTDQIKRIYKDVQQALPEKRKGPDSPSGLVHAAPLIPTDEDGNAIAQPLAEDMEREIKKQLPLIVIQLQQNGFEPKDIAILCRWKKECRVAAEALLQYKQDHPDCPYPMDIISNEALLLGSRPVIQTLICMMQLLQNPDSELQQAITWNNYLQLAGQTQEEAIGNYFRMSKEERTLLPQIGFRPLYELTELLIAQLPDGIEQREAAFLQSFRDTVLEYSHTHNADLSAFLEWWETTGCNKSIATPEAMNAIQIMTIHKSKGLGMPAVIIPYASWAMDIENNGNHKEIIWCEPKEEPFKQDILLPIQLSDKLMNTIFWQDYAEERLRTIIDNLNTAYVAFTRAKEAMVIMAPVPSGKKESRLEHLLVNYCNTLKETCEGITTIGSWQRAGKKAQEEASDTLPFDLDVIPSNAPKQLPKLSILHSPLQQDNASRKRGNCIHRVLQDVRDVNDYKSVIRELYGKRIIDSSLISQAAMETEIEHILSIPQVAEWFRPGQQVLNEQTLMDQEGNQIRPDRIIINGTKDATVIDYKTGNDHQGYRKQVKSYMNALKNAGFCRVRGFLLFLKDGKIVEVR